MTLKHTFAALTVLALGSACQLAQPFEEAEAPSGDFVASATYLKLSDGGDSGLFSEHVDNIVQSLPNTPGYLGHSLRAVIGGNENWTLTAWESEEAMLNFMMSEVHATAMADANQFSDTGKVVHWELAAEAFPPTWEDADTRLEDGREVY